MSAVTVPARYTLADLKSCVAGLMTDLAYFVMPDTYGCRECDSAMCARHCEQDAARERLERAAAAVLRAESGDEVRAAVMAALGDNGGTEG